MACSRCSSDKVVRLAYFDSPRSLCVCEDCGFSREVDDDPTPADSGDGGTADGCMDDVQVKPYCSKVAGPSAAQPNAGDSNRIVGLLHAPPKGVM